MKESVLHRSYNFLGSKNPLRESMMRFDKHTQGVGFVFGLRDVLAKSWFINNVKYI